MNRFEALLAPPTLSGREMAMHVRMQKEVSLSEAGTYRAQMLIPEIRLYDELTTLRFTRPGPDEENTAYRKACIAPGNCPESPGSLADSGIRRALRPHRAEQRDRGHGARRRGLGYGFFTV